jgi:hypothetical protein
MLGRKNGTPRAKRPRADKNCNGKIVTVSAKRTAQISVFNAFSYKKASRYGSSFSNRFHQIKVFNVKITKKGLCFGTVRFALIRKISV